MSNKSNGAYVEWWSNEWANITLFVYVRFEKRLFSCSLMPARARAHQHHTRICTLTSSHSVEQLRIYDNHARTHHIPILITTTGSVHSWYLRKLSLICFGPIFFSLCATPAPFAERTLSFTILSTQNLHRIFVARLTCIIMLIMGDNDGKPCSFRHTERMRMDNHKDKRKRGKRFIFTEIVSAANCSNRKFEISSKRDETREKEKTKHIRFIVFYLIFFSILFHYFFVLCRYLYVRPRVVNRTSLSRYHRAEENCYRMWLCSWLNSKALYTQPYIPDSYGNYANLAGCSCCMRPPNCSRQKYRLEKFQFELPHHIPYLTCKSRQIPTGRLGF